MCFFFDFFSFFFFFLLLLLALLLFFFLECCGGGKKQRDEEEEEETRRRRGGDKTDQQVCPTSDVVSGVVEAAHAPSVPTHPFPVSVAVAVAVLTVAVVLRVARATVVPVLSQCGWFFFFGEFCLRLLNPTTGTRELETSCPLPHDQPDGRASCETASLSWWTRMI